MLPIFTTSPFPPAMPVHEFGSQDDHGSLHMTEGEEDNAADSISIGVKAWTISITPKKLTSKTCFAASSEVSSAAP